MTKQVAMKSHRRQIVESPRMCEHGLSIENTRLAQNLKSWRWQS